MTIVSFLRLCLQLSFNRSVKCAVLPKWHHHFSFTSFYTQIHVSLPTSK